MLLQFQWIRIPDRHFTYLDVRAHLDLDGIGLRIKKKKNASRE